MLNYLSLCISPLTLALPSGERQATGFFYAHRDEIWLITNWHVLSGRDCRTGQPRSAKGDVPEIAFVSIPKEIDREIGHYDWDPLPIELENDAEPAWIQHPLGQEIDIAALNLGIQANGFDFALNSQKDYCTNLPMNYGEDVYILGYPLGIKPLGESPIWKRASFATFPTAKSFGKPAFLMDTATREGMSGSPIVFPEKQIYQMNDGGMRIGNGRYTIAGVYSGRFEDNADALGASLAIGWHQVTIDEMLTARNRGSHVLSRPHTPL